MSANLTTNITSLLTSVGAGVMDFALAPSGWGSYGGQLIVATTSGIKAVNLTTLAVTTIVASGFYPSIDFTLDGRLLRG